MLPIRNGLIVLGILLNLTTAASAEVSIGIGLPHVNIRLNLPLYPELVVVPGLPVYYAPRLEANYFFYDGYYWVYLDDDWYASDWYDGPWWRVEPDYVPLFVLRIPIYYYRQPPRYFYDWPRHQPPHWGDRWGHDWDRRHSGWGRWERHALPPPAPLPDYQRDYTGKRYPRGDTQQRLHGEHYRYQPRDETVREHFTPRRQQMPTPAQRGKLQEPMRRTSPQGDERRAPQPQYDPRDGHSRPSQPAPQPEHGPVLRSPTRNPPRIEQQQRPEARPQRDQRRQQQQGNAHGTGRDEGQGPEREQDRNHD